MRVQIGKTCAAKPEPLIWLEAGLGGSMRSWNLTFPILCRAFYCARSTRSPILRPDEDGEAEGHYLVQAGEAGAEGSPKVIPG